MCFLKKKIGSRIAQIIMSDEVVLDALPTKAKPSKFTVNPFLIASVVRRRLELCEGRHTPAGTHSPNEFQAQDIDIFYKDPKPRRKEFLGYNPTKLRFVSNSEYLYCHINRKKTGPSFQKSVIKNQCPAKYL